MKKAVITTIGKDTVGILAKVSNLCAENHANITDVTQSIMKDLFCMIMIADISNLNNDFSKLVDQLEELGKKENLKIYCMHEDVFNCMHKI